MGAIPYVYFVPYRQDIDGALQELKRRELDAGRYFPVVSFPFQSGSVAPGPQHGSIAAARDAAGATGTRSILDIDRVGCHGEQATATPIDDDELQRLYGTTRPTRELIEHGMGFFEDLARGEAVYTVVFKDDVPDEILFAGYSYD